MLYSYHTFCVTLLEESLAELLNSVQIEIKGSGFVGYFLATVDLFLLIQQVGVWG